MFRNLKIGSKLSSYPVEVLLNNRIDKEVHSIFYPFNFILTLFFSSKFSMKDNYITPNGNKYYIVLSFIVLFVIVICVYRICSGDGGEAIENDGNNMIPLFINLSYYTYYSFGYTMLFILNITHRDNNVLLILRIQIIHRSVDFSNRIRSFINWNWISLLFVVLIDIFIYTLFYASSKYLNNLNFAIDVTCDLMFTTFDINVVISIRIITLLRKYLEEWIKKAQMINDEQENDINCIKLFETYQDILEAYKLYKIIFQVLVS